MSNRCGIILSGGKGTRLGELTKGVSKQLMPVYKYPMVYYPINTLKSLGIDDILIIVASEQQLSIFKEYLGNGEKFQVKLTYIVQEKPNGLSEAFIIGEEFINGRDVALILGDNVFILNEKIEFVTNSIFTYKVNDPNAYGVLVRQGEGFYDFVEKPVDYISDEAIVGLYIFPSTCVDEAKQLKPSKRGELEIIDLIRKQYEKHSLTIQKINGVWFDCGTPDDLLECSEFVRALSKRAAFNLENFH